MISDSLKVFSGNANPKLAHAVAQYLNIPLGRATVNRFSDGEVTLSCFKAPVRRPMTI